MRHSSYRLAGVRCTACNLGGAYLASYDRADSQPLCRTCRRIGLRPRVEHLFLLRILEGAKVQEILIL